jgi:hypothetical protein
VDKKGQIGPHRIIICDFNTLLKSIGHLDRKKSTNTSELYCSIDQMDLTNIYKIFYPTASGCTFFSEAHETFSKIHHILGHKLSLNKYKKLK